MTEMPCGADYRPIEDYALLGDGRTVALVSRSGSVDWWPVPALDSPPVCAAILDPDRGGRFVLAPAEPSAATRRYLPGTNVLETTFRTSSGSVAVTECLNTGKAGRLPWVELARRVDGLQGDVVMRWILTPGNRFGEAKPIVHCQEESPRITIGEQSLALLVPGAAHEHPGGSAISGTFVAAPGRRTVIAAVATSEEPLFLPRPEDVDVRVDRTIASWEAWTELIDYEGGWKEAVVRSALTLKALLFEPGGAFAAAATTSLPERIGGDKNWDYRYSWIRDSSYAVDALINLSLDEEVQSAVSWVLSALRSSTPDVRVFYRLDGGVAGSEEYLLDAPGYRNSRPVRAGNRASSQTQLGTTGDLLDAMWRYVAAGHVLDTASAHLLADIADNCCDIWTERDSGIWELPRVEHYTISKIGCWTALDRAVRLADCGQLPTDRVERWHSEREKIRGWVNQHCWSEAQHSYTFYAGSEELDASVLLVGRTGFDRGPRLETTIDAVSAGLRVGSGPFLYRYTGMEAEEGAFVACTFWMVDALARTGQLSRATELMDAGVSMSNDVGLLAEQIDPRSRSFLGNCPQGLSHLALVNAASAIRAAERAPSHTGEASSP